MNLSELNVILSDVSFEGFTFLAKESGNRLYIQAHFLDTTDGSCEGEQYTRKWYISCHACKNEVVQTALKLVLTAIEHEAREKFRYKGARIFGPHYDVDQLVTICKRRENLDYRSKAA